MRISATVLSRSIVPLLAGLLFAACEPDDESADGTWQLVSIGDDALPADPEAGVRILDGSLEIVGDSLIWRETVVLGATVPGTGQTLEGRVATAFERDGALLVSRPSIVTIPDDTFQQCLTAGVYRMENGGVQLRQIGWVQDGECRAAVDPVVPERVYSRMPTIGW